MTALVVRTVPGDQLARHVTEGDRDDRREDGVDEVNVNVEILLKVAQLMRDTPDRRWHPVGDWLDREARRSSSHAMTAHKVPGRDWYSYQCVTCGVGGSASKGGLVAWQAAHGNTWLTPDDAALAVAYAYLGGRP